MGEKDPPPYRRERHPVPDYVHEALAASGLQRAYDDRPPYQRNDYIGWIDRAKRDDTRRRRLQQMLEELERGDTYMKMSWNPKGVK